VTFAGLLAVVALSCGGCSAFDTSLAREIHRGRDFGLVGDDGRCAVWSVRRLAADEGREWQLLLAHELRRVEDFFATATPGRVTLWLVDDLPPRFSGDAFAEGKDIYLRMGRGNRPTAGDVTLVAHELTHVVVAEAFEMERPFWFEEGLATYLEGATLGYGAGQRDHLSGVPALHRIETRGLRLADVESIDHATSYRLSAAAIELIIEKHGTRAIHGLQRSRGGCRFEDGYRRVTGETIGGLEARWRDEIRTASRLYR
jgi:hypothetical protein